ncbi:MAG: hypothetical protein HEQ39_03930 [Rhizobacter sp.]
MRRTAPPVHVLVDRFTVWTVAVAVLWLVAVCSLAAWIVGWSQSVTLGSSGPVHWFALGLSVPVLFAVPWFTCLRAVSLRWDGERWWLGEPSEVGVEPWCVQPLVRIDLGHWMLLQLKPQAAGLRLSNRYRWLPIQRRGLATQWHALRCALLTYPEPPRGLL